MFNVLQLFSLFILFCLTATFVKNVVLRKVIISVFILFFITQFVSIFLFGEVVNYKTYAHLSFEDIYLGYSQFSYEILVITIIIVVSFILAYYFKQYLKTVISKKIFVNRLFKGVLLILSIIILSMPTGIITNFITVIKIATASQNSLTESLNALDIDAKKYVFPKDLTAQKGKNIIIVSMESLEQNFLSAQFADLTPNLSKLSKEITFYPQMPQEQGASWTGGSLYTWLTGFPALHNMPANQSFQSCTEYKLTSLSDVLNKAGYNTNLFIGKPEFSGLDDLFDALKIHYITEKTTKYDVHKSTWGFDDYDLFKIARKGILELSKKDKPFCVGIVSVSTHFPNGIYDERMEQFVKKRENQLEFMVSALDYHIGELVSFLKKNNLYQNTVFYFFPDHLMMGGCDLRVKNKLNMSTRELMILTNAEPKDTGFKTSDQILQIDLPRLILNGAEIKTNAKFFTDYIPSDDKRAFLHEHQSEICSLNHAAKSWNEADKSLYKFVDWCRELLRKILEFMGIDESVKFVDPLATDQNVNIYSASWNRKKASIVSTSNQKIKLKRGITLFIRERGKLVDHNYDTFMKEKAASDFVELLIKTAQEKDYFFLVVHDTAAKRLKPYQKRLRRAGFTKLAALKKREAYVGYLANGILSEFVSPSSISLEIPTATSIQQDSKELAKKSKDTQRFIAHGGGVIMGDFVTNSLDALNLSYQKGYKLFELDIQMTSDGFYAAAHDWKSWARQTGYKGELPPSRDIFNSLKILGKYSPLDISAINGWFKKHPDAILVTDKVNTPKEFAKEFIDKNRLMMEMFTLDALKEGADVGILSVMPTHDLLLDIDKKGDFHLLNELNIKDVAVSKRIVQHKHISLLQKMKKAGIKAYVFHVNNLGVGEDFVLRNEFNYVYGMYSDCWTFNDYPKGILKPLSD